MATEQLPQEEFPYHLLFKPLASPPPETVELNLVEKYLKQIAAKELPGSRMSGTMCMTRNGAIAGPTPCAVTVRRW
jgi:hypothetical protein